MSNDHETASVTTLVPRRPQSESLAFRLMPASLGEAMEMAKLITSSDLCPQSYRGKPQDAIVAYEFGTALGFSWMQSLKHVAVINGVTSIFGDAIPAIIYGSGQCERFFEAFEGTPFEDDFKAVLILKRKGYPDERRFEYSVKDAKVAKLWGKQTRNGGDTPWITNPKRMLRFRCLGFGARDVFADKLSGLILAEEAMDYPDAIETTAVRVEEVVNPLDRIPEALREHVEKAFGTLNLSPGLRIAKINEFLNAEGVSPEDATQALLTWCRDEFARRKTGQPVQRTDNSKRSNAPVAGSVDGSAPKTGDVPITAADIPFGGGASTKPETVGF